MNLCWQQTSNIKPYYSQVLANFAMNVHLQTKPNDTFEIVELGGGRGTNAHVILNYMKEKHRDVYEKLESYTIFDTSKSLHELQKEVLLSVSDGEIKLHDDKVKLMNDDLIGIAEGTTPFLSPSKKLTVVFALELLDNLPHDKIARCIHTHEILQGEIFPCESSANTHHCEVFKPINDKLLKSILSIAPGLYAPKASQCPRWIPTTALGVLLKLFDCRPNTSIAFADFDWLPPPDLADSCTAALAEPSIGDPLVTDMDGNDHACYLSSPRDALCDILFPTDFERLAGFLHAVINLTDNVSVSHMKQSEFLLKYGRQEVEKTKSWLTGYSPLINDFGNCSVLEVTPRLLAHNL